jgi:hypothetical protein
MSESQMLWHSFLTRNEGVTASRTDSKKCHTKGIIDTTHRTASHTILLPSVDGLMVIILHSVLALNTLISYAYA